MYYIFNGKLLKKNEKAMINPLSDGAMYGYGLFETIKVKNKKPIFLQSHLDRLRTGLNKLGIISLYSDKKIKEFVKKLINKNLFDGALKIVIIKKKNISDLIILMQKSKYNYQMYKKGFNVKVSDVLRNSTSKLVKFKTINYLENIFELKNAKKDGFNEVIFFNEKGFLAEGSISNIFVVKDDKIYTPSLSNGLLNGIIRQKIINFSSINILKANISKKFVSNADEIFLTNSLMEVMPVYNIDSLNYYSTNFEKSKILRKLIKKEI